MAAAPADYRPCDPAGVKRPRSAGGLTIQLEPTVDVLAATERERPTGLVTVTSHLLSELSQQVGIVVPEKTLVGEVGARAGGPGHEPRGQVGGTYQQALGSLLVKLETAYREIPAIGLNISYLYDPMNVYIEMTEGYTEY